MLKKYSLRALQKAVNHAMDLDDQIEQKTASLNGKVLEMIVTPLGVHFFIEFKNGHVILHDTYDKPADTIIHSNPIGLIRLSFLPASKARSLFNDSVRLSGDIETGQLVKKLFDEFDIDWEGHLAHFTGDVVAHQIGSFVRKSKAFTKQFGHSMRANLTEFLQDELAVSPCRAELEDFYNDIDELVLDVERIEAQINRLVVDNEIN